MSFLCHLQARLAVISSVWIGIACVGCGVAPPKLVPVRGKVLVEGEPVTFGTISFRPDAKRGNTSMEQPGGSIGPDGSFELMSAEKPGALPGWYRVLVMADNFQVIDPPPSPVWPNYPEGFLKKPLVNDRYLYFHKTDLSVEVRDDAPPDAYTLQLKP